MEKQISKKSQSATRREKAVIKQLVGQALSTHMRMLSVDNVPSRNFSRPRRVWRRWIQTTAVTNQAFSLANGHDQFLVITTIAGAAVSYVDSWCIKKIVLSAAPLQGATCNVTLTPIGTDLTSNMRNDEEKIFSLNARSTAKLSCMEIIPAKDEPLGGIHFTSNVNFAGALFQINIQAATTNGVTLDIEFEIVDNLAGLPLGYGTTTGTTTLGTIGGRNVMSGFTLVGINNLG
jgi:hypothetical protein